MIPMRRAHHWICMVVLASVIATASAMAGQPDPANCSGEERIGASPKNVCVGESARYVYVFTLRDNTNAPVEGFPASQVELDFGDCFEPSTRPTTEIPADGPSDVNGDIRWFVNLNFGGSDPCAVNVLVQNVVFQTIVADFPGGVRNPDENGDGNIALTDLSLFQQCFVGGGPPYCCDLAEPFDGLCSLTDLSIFQQHFVCN